MRSIAVVGAGQIGSAFAYKLAKAGNDVTVVARPGSTRLEQLKRDGGIVLRSGDRAEVRIADALDESHAYDLVIVTTLAHQIEPLLPALRRSASSAIQCMFVTFAPERLRETIGPERCTLGMPFLMAKLDADGKLGVTVRAAQKTLHGDARWAALFNAAGLPSVFEPDMARWLRSHAPLTIAFESISILGQRRGSGASWREALVVARGALAAFAIVKGLGYKLYPLPKALIASLPAVVLAALLWTMSRLRSFRELLATGIAECRSLADAIAAAADDMHPPMTAAAAAVRTLEPSS